MKGSVKFRGKLRKRELYRGHDVRHPSISPLFGLFLGCFAMGVILLNVLGKEHVVSFFAIDSYFYQKVSGMDVPKAAAFFYLLGRRSGAFLLLFMVSFTRMYKLAHGIFCGYVGLGLGVIAASFVAVFGGKGVLLFLLSLFPQMFVYGMMYLLLLALAGVVQNQFIWERDSYHGRKVALLAGMTLGVALLFLLGVFVESYMNPYFLSKAGTWLY